MKHGLVCRSDYSQCQMLLLWCHCSCADPNMEGILSLNTAQCSAQAVLSTYGRPIVVIAMYRLSLTATFVPEQMPMHRHNPARLPWMTKHELCLTAPDVSCRASLAPPSLSLLCPLRLAAAAPIPRAEKTGMSQHRMVYPSWILPFAVSLRSVHGR